MKQLNVEQKCLLILGIFSFSILIVLLPISIVLKLYGLTIGWVIGSLATFLNTFLLFKSGNAIMNSAKENQGLSFSFIFYIFRFLLIIASFVTCALLHFLVKGVFVYSLYTCACSVLPSSLIIVLFYKESSSKEVNQ